jgi:hypothetical protein
VLEEHILKLIVLLESQQTTRLVSASRSVWGGFKLTINCLRRVAIHVTSYRKACVWEGKPEHVWRIWPEIEPPINQQSFDFCLEVNTEVYKS